MRRVIIESPLAGATPEDVAQNVAYAKAAMRDCFARGEASFASHLLYPLVFDDSTPEQRRAGMLAGFAWGEVADATVVYTDRGISSGMQDGIARANLAGRTVEYRTLVGRVDDLKALPGESRVAELERTLIEARDAIRQATNRAPDPALDEAAERINRVLIRGGVTR